MDNRDYRTSKSSSPLVGKTIAGVFDVESYNDIDEASVLLFTDGTQAEVKATGHAYCTAALHIDLLDEKEYYTLEDNEQ